MANTTVTPTWVTKSTARGYTNSVKFVGGLTQKYSSEFSQAGASVGDTVKVRLPQRWTVSHGEALQEQDILDATVNVSLSDVLGVHMGWSTVLQTTDLQMIKERYTTPAANRLANAADILAYAEIYPKIYNSVGTPGTGPITSNETYMDAVTRIIDGADDGMSLRGVLSPRAQAKIVAANLTLFNPQAQVGKMFKSGQFGGAALGVDEWFYDQNAPVHTTGTYTASTPLVNGASQTGASLVTNGWASGATSLKKGDIFEIHGVNAVNLESYADTGRRQQFVVKADISDTTGAITIAIDPPIITSGQLQTVTASPADDAVIYVLGATGETGGTLTTTTSRQGIIYKPDLGTFVTADLVKPDGGAEMARVSSERWSVAVRMVKAFDIKTNRNITRLDMLCGASVLQPRLGCRTYE